MFQEIALLKNLQYSTQDKVADNLAKATYPLLTLFNTYLTHEAYDDYAKEKDTTQGTEQNREVAETTVDGLVKVNERREPNFISLSDR